MEKVEEIVTTDVVTVKENHTLMEAAKIIRERNISGAPVLNEEGDVVGVLSEADVLKVLGELPWYSLNKILHLQEQAQDTKHEVEKMNQIEVREVMSKHPQTVDSDDLINDAASIMHSSGYNRLPVVDNSGKLVGIVTRADILASLQED
ncbi:MAG: CBS domain-containing protein [Archaeoglobaceae archaeon]